eukprot:218743-Alexandrium_andersonii.AAC.1
MRTDCGRNIRIYQVGVATVALLRRGPDRQVGHHVDTAGRVSASSLLQTDAMKRFGSLSEEDLRILIEMENSPKARFLMAWGHD